MANRKRLIPILMILFVPVMITGCKDATSDLEGAVRKGNLDEVKSILANKPKLVNARGRLRRTPLYWAALRGHKEIIEFLISKGADVNAKDNYGYTPLHNAATLGHKEISEFLIDNGAEVNSKANPLSRVINTSSVRIKVKGEYKNWTEDPGNTLSRHPLCGNPLHNAAYNGHNDVVELLIANGAEVNGKNQLGFVPLHSAASQDQTETVKLLVANGADINVKNSSGYTPLALVACRAYEEVVKVLLANGADVSTTDNYGRTPLYRAVGWYGNKEIAEMLIANGAKVNVRDNHNQTPLYWAAAATHKDIVEMLVANGAKVNIRDDSFGRTPLHNAVMDSHKLSPDSNRSQIAAILLAKGADVNAKDKEGNTPLHFATQQGHTKTIEILIANGADVEAKDGNGRTALHIAEKMASKGRYWHLHYKDIFFLLLKHGKLKPTAVKKLQPVKVELRDKNTSLLNAARKGQKYVVEFLIDNGAEVNSKDNFGNTPLHRAAIGGHRDVVELLIARGADVNARNKRGRSVLHYTERGDNNDIIELLRKHGAVDNK